MIILKIKYRWILLFLCIALFTGCSASPVVIGNPTPVYTIALSAGSLPGVTPTYKPVTSLLAKYVAVGPVYVTGDSTVPDAALKEAGTILAIMLQHRPDIGIILRANGAFTVVSSRSQRICDLPYFTQYNASLCGSYGEGGAGGVPGHPITACDEKNLLKEPDDPYQRGSTAYSQNICVHELAHTIMNVGLSQTDRDRIEARYLAAQQEGLWKGDYAMTNDLEFWAVMSQFYFSAGPEATYSAFNHIANGPASLKKYDPVTFALLDSIYQGSANLS
jgi:hypothetical protein